jgi:hypothetical protein
MWSRLGVGSTTSNRIRRRLRSGDTSDAQQSRELRAKRSLESRPEENEQDEAEVADLNRDVRNKEMGERCTIKGNVNCEGERIYHMPGCGRSGDPMRAGRRLR